MGTVGITLIHSCAPLIRWRGIWLPYLFAKNSGLPNPKEEFDKPEILHTKTLKFMITRDECYPEQHMTDTRIRNSFGLGPLHSSGIYLLLHIRRLTQRSPYDSLATLDLTL